MGIFPYTYIFHYSSGMWVTRRLSYKKLLRNEWIHPKCFGEVGVADHFSFLFLCVCVFDFVLLSSFCAQILHGSLQYPFLTSDLVFSIFYFDTENTLVTERRYQFTRVLTCIHELLRCLWLIIFDIWITRVNFVSLENNYYYSVHISITNWLCKRISVI